MRNAATVNLNPGRDRTARDAVAFDDGHRRITTNPELVADEERTIILTIFHSNYLTGLKMLSNSGNPGTLIRSLHFAQKWVPAVP